MTHLDLWVFQPPVAPENRERYEAAFAFWHEIWREANAEMIRPTEFPSDSFTRQSEIICLFDGAKPVALICHRHCDFGADSSYRDSTFFPGTWRDEDKARVRAIGGLGLMGSMITVHKDFRASSDLSTKYLIVLLSLARAQAIGAETVVASVRTAKGLDKVFGGAGSTLIAPARPFFGAAVDLIAFEPQKSAITIASAYSELVSDLWSRAHFSQPMKFETQRKGIKAA